MGRRKYERRAVFLRIGAVRGAGEDGAQQGAAVHAAQSPQLADVLPVGGVDDADGTVTSVRVAFFVAQRVDGRHLGSKSVVCCLLLFAPWAQLKLRPIKLFCSDEFFAPTSERACERQVWRVFPAYAHYWLGPWAVARSYELKTPIKQLPLQPLGALHVPRDRGPRRGPRD